MATLPDFKMTEYTGTCTYWDDNENEFELSVRFEFEQDKEDGHVVAEHWELLDIEDCFNAQRLTIDTSRGSAAWTYAEDVLHEIDRDEVDYS